MKVGFFNFKVDFYLNIVFMEIVLLFRYDCL